MNPSTPNKLLIPAVIVIVALILVGGVYWIHYSQSVNQPQAINMQNVAPTPAPVSSSQNPINASSTSNQIVSKTVQPIHVLFPNGGESFKTGDIVTIKWVAPGFGSAQPVNIYLMRTDETATAIIAKNVPNSGSYQWTVFAPGSYIISVSIPDSNGLDSIDNPNSDSSDSAFTVTATSTAGWKTYINAQYGYEVKYPIDGALLTGNGPSETGGNWVDITLWTSNDGVLHPDSKTMFIQVDEAVSMHPCNDPFKNPDGTITKNLTEVYLNGVEFTKGDVSPYRNLDLEVADEYCAVRNGNRYQIIVGQYIFGGKGPGSPSPMLESDTLINQAISTFKFTN